MSTAETAQPKTSGFVRASVLQTHDVPPKHRFDVFRRRFEILTEPHKVIPNKVRPEQFSAELQFLVTANTQTGSCASSPLFMVNPKSAIAHARDDRVIFFALDSGDCVIEARESQHHLVPGGLALLSPGEAYRLIGSNPHQSFMSNIPTDRLSLSSNAIRALSFSSLARDQGATSMFSNGLRALFGAGPLDNHGVDRYITGLADLVLRSALGLDPDHADTHVVRRAQVERFVRHNITNANLHADLIAAELRLSRRLLYRLFEGQPETLAELIQRERVSHAKRLIDAEQGKRLSLEQLARLSGFSSTRTFVRAFQRAHGMTPAYYVRASGP